MAEGGFNLRKWTSNSSELMLRIVQAESQSPTGVATTQASNEDKWRQFIVGNSNFQPKLLGVGWNSCSDEFSFGFSELIDQVDKLSPSRRSLLKVAASIFDPLGIISPFVIRLKMLFQTLCCQRADWDQPLEGDYLKQWREFRSEFEVLNETRIPRCYFRIEFIPQYSELMLLRCIWGLFTEMALSLFVWLPQRQECLSPVKKQSIPRLELLGALILMRLTDIVPGQLPLQLKATYWVDSTAALFWIKHQRPWKQYISRQVSEICSCTSSVVWRHCPGVVNPADLPSRGLNV